MIINSQPKLYKKNKFVTSQVSSKAAKLTYTLVIKNPSFGFKIFSRKEE